MRCKRAEGSAPEGSTRGVTSTAPDVVLSPSSSCSGLPFTTLSATTKISFLDGSITGVPEIPTDGEMSPQGSLDEGTALPTCRDQTTLPVEDDSAYTMSLSVATKTRAEKTRGSP